MPDRSDLESPRTPSDLDLEGRTFVSAANDEALVEGSVLRLQFDRGRMAMRAGCNQINGNYRIAGDVLSWESHPVTTMMACPDELMAQDRWLIDLFIDGVPATVEGPTLTLSTGSLTLRLAEESREPAEGPHQP